MIDQRGRRNAVAIRPDVGTRRQAPDAPPPDTVRAPMSDPSQTPTRDPGPATRPDHARTASCTSAAGSGRHTW